MKTSDHSLIIRHDSFLDLIAPDASVDQLWTGGEWVEGPAWLPGREALVFSDIPNDRMLVRESSGEVEVFRAPCGKSNGNTVDMQGRLVTCEHLTNRVTRTEADGSVTVLAETLDGKRLNSPNDVVVRSDGVIWFTDPPYGILTEREGRVRDSELDGNYVFRLDPSSGELAIVASDFERPNGLALSPDESRLYVADSGPARHIRVFDFDESGGQLTNDRVFVGIDAGVPDGFRVDVHGNVWSSAADGIHVFDPDGVLLGRIPVPEKVSNCEFGGVDGQDLFITASTSLYHVRVEVRGAIWGRSTA